MSKVETGDVIICNDVVGIVTRVKTTTYVVRLEDNTDTELSRSANIQVVASAYSIAALVYNKVLKRMENK